MKQLVKIRTIILGLLLLSAVVANAQHEKVIAAYTFLKQNNLDSAKANIDAAILHPKTANDPDAWYYRGFIYKTIYNTNEKGKMHAASRLESLNSFKKSILLDTAKEYFSDNIGSLKYLANTFHNDAAESLELFDYKTAIELFNKSQECFKLIDPSPAANQEKEIEFDLALGSVYYSIIESSKKDSAKTYKFLNLAKALYNRVLLLDPDNISANYQMGILYYNQAVNLVLAQDIDADLVDITRVIDNSTKLFKESLPFMEKAYTLAPTRIETLQGLTGIYWSLNEPEKSNIYKQKLNEIRGFKVGDKVQWVESSIIKKGVITVLVDAEECMVKEDGKEKSKPLKFSILTKVNE